MKKSNALFWLLVLIFRLFFLSGCKTDQVNIVSSDREPVLEPDYSGVTVPVNIAPLNFRIKEDGNIFTVNATSPTGFHLSVRSSDGIARFPLKKWKKLLADAQGGKIEVGVSVTNKTGDIKKFNPVYIHVVSDPVDPYLCYRLLYPGYETYLQIKIIQRNITDFTENSLVENQLLKNNCVNCHSFFKNSPEKFLIHVRGTVGGTYFVNGKRITKTNLKTKEMNSGAVYPAWHPNGRYVTFSSNNILQSFHAAPEENIEVTDLSSSLVLYDTEKNVIGLIEETDTSKFMETFPEWSPDGKYLYYCRADQYVAGNSFKTIKYNLVRKSFDPDSKSFGKAEVVFDAKSINKSISYPRLSPDGKYLVFTLHDYGNFSIWHKESDLYLLDNQTGNVEKMSLNSNETESWHCWSTNSKWLVFSSKRGDGLTARPYFAYLGLNGVVGKPFVLPQKDPTLYRNMILTFNRPEFVTGKINLGPRDFEKASKIDSVKTIWANYE
jgi:hypothetical protein